MKKITLFLTLLALSSITPAKASPITFLGNLNINDSGSFTNNALDLSHGAAQGTIPAQSSITFTYNFSNTPAFGKLASTGFYSEKIGQKHYSYSSFSGGLNLLTIRKGLKIKSIRSLPLSDMLVQATADQTAFTTTITNMATNAAGFTTAFLGLLGKGTKLTNVSYVVSAVPIPAALPLFGLALAGAAGYSRRKKKMA